MNSRPYEKIISMMKFKYFLTVCHEVTWTSSPHTDYEQSILTSKPLKCADFLNPRIYLTDPLLNVDWRIFPWVMTTCNCWLWPIGHLKLLRYSLTCISQTDYVKYTSHQGHQCCNSTTFKTRIKTSKKAVRVRVKKLNVCAWIFFSSVYKDLQKF